LTPYHQGFFTRGAVEAFIRIGGVQKQEGRIKNIEVAVQFGYGTGGTYCDVDVADYGGLDHGKVVSKLIFRE
jgi:hypothetical protein